MKKTIKKSDLQVFIRGVNDNIIPLTRDEENNETVQTWVPWFRDTLRCEVKFDVRTTHSNNRPDVQVWASKKAQNACLFAPLWLEAKPLDSFKSKAKLRSALNEAFDKVRLEARSRHVPPALIVSDLERVVYWSPERVLKLLKDQGPSFEDLSNASGQFYLTENSDSEFQTFAQFLERSLSEETASSKTLDIDSFVADLLVVTKQFQRTVLPLAYSSITSDKKMMRIFGAWKSHGGDTTISLVRKDDINNALGEEETFSELCFHTLIVRCFAIKWCLDHGYLEETSLKTAWNSLQSQPNKENFDKILRPRGKSEIEKLLARVFAPTNMYMWINHVMTDDIRVGIYNAFKKQALISSETDILGEFYQKYLSAYSRRSQFELGQFYTPHQLVRAMWKLTSDSLSERGISLDDDSTIIVDPSAGTGTFLTQGFRYTVSGNWGESRKRLSGRSIAKYVKRFSGLELNPFSKGVADINFLTEVLSHCGGFSADEIPIPSIFETNSYEINPQRPDAKSDDDEDIKQWVDRWHLSGKAKRESKYRVVIGNPPWRNPSPVNNNPRLKEIVDRDLVPWAHEYQDQKLSSIRGCNHGIREDYIFFFGVATQLVQSDGLICYVTSESWLDAPTYTLARKFLLDSYDIKRVIRIGPYFKNVAQPASIVIMEKNSSCGRDQKIKFLDWSEVSNGEYSSAWISQNINRIIDGSVRRTEWKEIQPRGDNCVILPTNYDSRGLDDFTVSLDEIFVQIIQGAQPGYSPLFLDLDRNEVIRKARLLLSADDENLRQLASELAPGTRGGVKKARELIARASKMAQQVGAVFDAKAVREVHAHFKDGPSQDACKVGFCYFDSRIWLFPRVEPRVKPNIETIWDRPFKLVFRDFSDTGKKKKTITAFVDSSRRVIDNHSINGGSQVVSIDNKLTCIDAKFRSSIQLSPQEWCYYVYAIFNSNYAAAWAKENTKQRLKIPLCKEFIDEMKAIAKLGIKHQGDLEKSKAQNLSEAETMQVKNFNTGVDAQIDKMAMKIPRSLAS